MEPTDSDSQAVNQTAAKKDEDKNDLGWHAGFTLVTLAVTAVFIYTLTIKDMTLYQLAILGISLYTMLTMGICLVAKRKNVAFSDERPFISILVPAKNEELVIENTVRSLFKINYKKTDGSPNYEVIVIDDNSSDSTLATLNRLKNEYPSLVPLHRKEGQKGKSAVLNFAVPKAKGDLIAVFDADTFVDKDFFEKTVPYLSAPNIVGVQGRVRIFNKNDNILTRLQDDEFTVFAHMLQMSKSIFGGIMQLAGNGQIVKKDALMSVGGWNEKSATDDQDLTIKFLLKGLFINYVPEAIIWQEAIRQPFPLLRQRIRWAEGMLRCIFDYFFPVIFHKKLTLIQKIDGLAGLMRIVGTLIVWVGYVQIATVYIFNITYYSCAPMAVMCNIVLILVFITVMLGGLIKYLDNFNPYDLIRFPVYWAYNTIWLIAAPIGYINAIQNKNTIKWDKTEHNSTTAELV